MTETKIYMTDVQVEKDLSAIMKMIEINILNHCEVSMRLKKIINSNSNLNDYERKQLISSLEMIDNIDISEYDKIQKIVGDADISFYKGN